jgi:hypothetical protein
MARFDITKTNEAVRRLLEVTTNPRHRFLLAAYDRHRNLEMAGRYEEIFVPEMTVEHPNFERRNHASNTVSGGVARRASAAGDQRCDWPGSPGASVRHVPCCGSYSCRS